MSQERSGILGEILNGPASDPLAPNAREAAVIAQVAPAFGQDPEEYVAIPVMVQIDPTRQGGVGQVQTSDGRLVEMVVVPLMLLLPEASTNHSRVLMANGQMADPLLGMLPHMEARLVVPAARIKKEVLAQMRNPQGSVN